jgi:hypothetical protein
VEIECSPDVWARVGKPSCLCSRESLQLDFVWSRRVNYCFVSFYFYFRSKMVSVGTFRVKLRENSFGIDVKCWGYNLVIYF